MLQIFLKEHSRGLYSCRMQWLLEDIPLLTLRAVHALIYSFPLHEIVKLKTETGIDSIYCKYCSQCRLESIVLYLFKLSYCVCDIYIRRREVLLSVCSSLLHRKHPHRRVHRLHLTKCSYRIYSHPSVRNSVFLFFCIDH